MNMNEDISVVASFGKPYKIRPVRFRWGQRLLDVREVTYFWTTMDGQAAIYHFSVTDGSGSGSTYELTFNTKSLVWKLAGAIGPHSNGSNSSPGGAGNGGSNGGNRNNGRHGSRA